MIVTLVLMVCLSANPTVCREERPPLEDLTSLGCLIQGQQIAAEWVQEHPKWRVSGWRCQLGRREQPI